MTVTAGSVQTHRNNVRWAIAPRKWVDIALGFEFLIWEGDPSRVSLWDWREAFITGEPSDDDWADYVLFLESVIWGD